MIPLRVRKAIQAIKNSGNKGPIKFCKTTREYITSTINEMANNTIDNAPPQSHQSIYRIYNPETNETLATLPRQKPLENEISIKKAKKSKIFSTFFHKTPMISTQIGGRMITSSVDEKKNIRLLEKGNISITSSPKAALFKKQGILYNLLYRSYKPTGLPLADMIERRGDTMIHHIHWLPSDSHGFRGSASYQQSIKSPQAIVQPQKEGRIFRYMKNLQSLISELS